MNIWTMENWKTKYTLEGKGNRSGLRLRFDMNVNTEVKRACKDFCRWLRKEYIFPFRIPVYVRSSEKIRAKDGDMVLGKIWLPFDNYLEPYVTIATGYYEDLVQRKGEDNALAAVLHLIAHELTHYFQWINNIELTDRGAEWQATYYANMIIDEYAETRDHP